jgi:hypothetical protein
MSLCGQIAHRRRGDRLRDAEAEQGMNVARIAMLAGGPAERGFRRDDQSLLLVGLQAVAMAADRIRSARPT